MTLSYVIEHMEDDDDSPKAIPPWVELEYAHMRSLAGPAAQIHFTSLSSASRSSLSTVSIPAEGLADASCHQAGIMQLMEERGVELSKVCLLDPKAEKALAPEDGDGEFEWFLFGGILGDDPPRDRTSELRVRGFPTRHLGPVQMTTDTALGVTKKVVHDKVPLDKIPYVDFPTIRFNAKESVEMPFRYIANEKSEPILPVGMRDLLHEDLNKSFDF
ncbi:hypothetical protein MIND_00777000 [Mycena indigotica]|uniref:DUF431-domain-containing protein n=1 Tax=Mycena indigotica TaxID=2126181 RepID=A0A8H6W215_9AGAR|nr:uncharacterized protein MIND_00777000 [Mycena indigotica]KAF7302102.1 hypothetical protein MIND_00777000 [Mycena indigotica]